MQINIKVNLYNIQCLTVTEGINIKFNLLGFVIPTERFKSFILTFLYNPILNTKVLTGFQNSCGVCFKLEGGTEEQAQMWDQLCAACYEDYVQDPTWLQCLIWFKFEYCLKDMGDCYFLLAEGQGWDSQSRSAYASSSGFGNKASCINSLFLWFSLASSLSVLPTPLGFSGRICWGIYA